MRRTRLSIDVVPPIVLAFFLLGQGAVAGALWAGHFGPTPAPAGMCTKLLGPHGARSLFKTRPAAPQLKFLDWAALQPVFQGHLLGSARFLAHPGTLCHTLPPPADAPARGPPVLL